MRLLISNVSSFNAVSFESHEFFDWLIAWQNLTVPEYMEDKSISIIELVEENASKYKACFLDIVDDIYQQKDRMESVHDILKKVDKEVYWWMSLLTEKSNMNKSPEIEDAIKILALQDWLIANNPSQVNYYGPKDNTADCLSVLCERNQIEFDHCVTESAKQRVGSRLHTIYHSLPTLAKAIIYLCRYFWVKRHFVFDSKAVTNWRNTQANTTFVSYLGGISDINDPENLYANKYWDNLDSKLLKEDTQFNALYLYSQGPCSSDVKSALETVSILNKNENQTHACIDSFWSIHLFLKLLSELKTLFLVYSSVSRSIKKNADGNVEVLFPLLSPLIEDSFRGPTAVWNVIIFLLFGEAFSYLPKQNKCVYVQENQGWELGMVWAWRLADHGETAGFIHTPLRYWDMRYFYREEDINQDAGLSVPIPDKSLCGFQSDIQMLTDFGYPESRLVPVEPLRYMNLFGLESRCDNSESRAILVFGEIIMSKNIELLQTLTSISADIPEGVKVLFKPHPNMPVDVTQFPDLPIETVQGTISDIVARALIAYAFASSSAAFDASVLGCPVITLLSKSRFNASPLRGDPSAVFVKNGEELRVAMKEVYEEEGCLRSRCDVDNSKPDRSLRKWEAFLSA